MKYVLARWPKEIEPVVRVIEQIVGRVRLLTGGDFFIQESVRDRGMVHLDMSEMSTVLGAEQCVRCLLEDDTGFLVRGVVVSNVFVVEELVILDVPIGEEGVAPISGPEEYEFLDEELVRLNKELQT